MKTLGIVYWPRKGSVELNARRICSEWGETDAELIPLREADLNNLSAYRYLVIGCSTVGADSWRDAYSGNQWMHFFLKLNQSGIDFHAKKIALFGLGDQILYPEHYVDEMARIADELKAHGADIVGKWPVTGYEHTDSKSIRDGYFIGLALDEHNQAEMSERRIREWVNDLRINHFQV